MSEADAQRVATMPGDVIQITKAFPNPLFHGSFAVVEETKGWGVKADVPCPEVAGATYPVRVAWDQLHRIGRALKE